MIGYDKYRPAAELQAMGVEPMGSMAEVLEQSDYVTIHVPLTDETRGMVTENRCSRSCEPEAILVNTSRGPVIDEPALIDVLRDQRITSAALDVYQQEPLQEDSPAALARQRDPVAARSRLFDRGDGRPARRHGQHGRGMDPRQLGGRVVNPDVRSHQRPRLHNDGVRAASDSPAVQFGGDDQMTIERVETFVLVHQMSRGRGPSIANYRTRESVLVKISDSSGAAGWGETYASAGIGQILRDIGAMFIGKDPLRSREIWTLAWNAANSDTATSVLSIAIDDLRGKLLNRPACAPVRRRAAEPRPCVCIKRRLLRRRGPEGLLARRDSPS